jgi:hypothetical protein
MPFVIPALTAVGGALSAGALTGAAAATAGGLAIGGTALNLIGQRGQTKAIGAAAQQQQAANDAAIAEQRRQFDVTQASQQPFIQAGQQALGGQGDLLGLNGPAAQQAAIQALMQGPGYQSLYGNGVNTILSNAAATGGLRGGNTQRSLADFGRDSLAQVIQQQIGNLGGVAGQGASVGNSLGALGAENSGNIGNILVDSGVNQAGSIIGRANGNASSLDSIAQLLAKLGGGIKTGTGLF